MKHPRLWTACLALLPLAVCPAPAPAQAPATAPSSAAPVLIGTVAKISIVGLKNISTDTVQSKLTLKVGDVYTPAAAQKDVDALKSMGVFQSTISVSATQTSLSGINLTYTVAENPVVKSIKFTTNAPNGKPSVSFSELFSQMKTRVGQVLNTNVLVKDVNSLFNHTDGYAVKQGHLLDVSSADIDPKTGILTILLAEYYVQSIQITGNSRIKTADILAQMHTKVGDIFDRDALVADMGAVYATGKFRAANFTVTSMGPGKVAITVPVIEQPAATGSLDEKQGEVIPFAYDPITSPYPVVQVSVNGKPPLPFVVDTGTTAALSINPWAAQQLGLKADGTEGQGIGFTFVKLPSQHIVLLGADHAHDVKLEAPTVQIVNFEFMDQVFPGQRIAGLLGLGLLAPITSRFDFAAKTLTLFTTPHPPLSTLGGIVLPLYSVLGGAELAVRASLAPGTEADLIVDTGSVETQIPLSALPTLHPAAVAFAGGSVRIQGIYFGPDLRLTDLKLGHLDVPNAVVGTLPSSSGTSLGLDILAGYRLTLDGPNGQLTLEPSAKDGRYVYGKSGLDIKPASENWAISEFQGKSPAQSAGLQLNDELVTVDGINVRGLSKLQVGHLLSGIVGVPVHVQALRTGKKIALSWMPVDEFSSSHSAVDGLAMDKAPGDVWMILALTKGCPGDAAGLLIGDKIIQIDGEDTVSLSLDRYSELFRKPTLTLQIERAGIAEPFTVRLSAAK